jgi:ABC-type transport system substrate-binding protein
VQRERLLKIDLRSHRITRSVRLPWTPARRMALGGGFVWLTQLDGPGVLGIDAVSGRARRRFAVVGGHGIGVAYGNGSLWLAQGTHVSRVDPRRGRVLDRIPLRPGQESDESWLVFADGWLWAAAPDQSIVRKIDPVADRVVARVQLGDGWISDLTAGDRGVWVSVAPQGLVHPLSADDLVPDAPVRVGADPERLSLVRGRLWTANTAGAALAWFSPATGARGELRLTGRPLSVLRKGGLLLSVASPETLLPPVSGEEIVMSSPVPVHAGFPPVVMADPQRPHDLHDRELDYATCANLLGYPEANGPAGSVLQPEVAAAMPSVSGDGLTYTFRIRHGFRFSPPSNEPVTAQTFRYSIERALSKSLSAAANGLGTDIAGQAAFASGSARHIAGVAARGDILRVTLTHPNGNFLALISRPEFCPVPNGTPVRAEAVTGAIPRDGPYYVSSVTDDRIVLLRNPNYPGRRLRRPARIVFESGTPTSEAVDLTNRGRIDYLPPDFGSGSALLATGDALDRRFGPGSAAARRGDQRYYHQPIPIWDGIVINARTPLFRDARKRRAVEYALDRVALARQFGDVPSESIVPSAVPGFGNTDVYPPRGNLLEARRLFGQKRRRATLYYCTNGPFGGQGQAQSAAVIRAQLARIGLDVTITSPPCGPDGLYDGNSRRAELVLVTSFSPVADPAPFLEQVVFGNHLGAALGKGPWSERLFRSRLRGAAALEGHARVGAYRRLEDELLRAAPVAVYGTWYDTYGYFSPRVGCRIIPPGVAAVDLGALCKHR